jgi:hypothetical protein
MNELASQVTASGLVVWALQWLKNTNKFPWVNENTAALNRILAALLAAASAVGITYTYEPTAGVLAFTGLTAPAVLAFVWKVLTSVVLQEVIYRSTVKK